MRIHDYEFQTQTRIAYTRNELTRIAYTRPRISKRNSYCVYAETRISEIISYCVCTIAGCYKQTVIVFFPHTQPMTISVATPPTTHDIYDTILAGGRRRLPSAYSCSPPASSPACQTVSSACFSYLAISRKVSTSLPLICGRCEIRGCV